MRRIRLPDGKIDPTHISNSHQSFRQKVMNFDKYVKFVELNTNYTPNENDLKIATLKTFYTTVNDAVENVNELITEALLKRIERNYALYEEEIGIIDVALDCKKYVRSAYGMNSEEAKAVGKIMFKRFMRLKKRE